MRSTSIPSDSPAAPSPIRVVPAPADLIDEISFGVAELDREGNVLSANPAARALLQGVAGGRLVTTLVQMAERVRSTEGHIEAVIQTSGVDVRLLVARTAEGCLAYLERDLARSQRVQVQILRTMLAAVCEDGSLESAASRALLALAWIIPETHLVLFGLSAENDNLVCLAQARVPPGQDAHWMAQPLDEDSPIGRAAATGAPSHRLEPAERDGVVRSTYALPVKSGARVLGVLYACGPARSMGENELRLLQGMTDAAASLLQRARQDSILQVERASRKALEEEQESARRIALENEALATAGKLSACVLHEINNPLAFIRTNLNVVMEQAQQLLQLSAGGQPRSDASSEALEGIAGEIRGLVEECLEGLEHITSVTSILKGLARAQPKERIQFAPARPIHDAIHMFRRAKLDNGQVEVELDPALPELIGSPVALTQVLLNLMENALDAMGGNGTIRVKASCTSTGLKLEVVDQGLGIPQELQDRIYQPYFTTKAPGKGTGLGLYITRDIVERMGGRIDFRSGPSGTVFWVELPGTGR